MPRKSSPMPKGKPQTTPDAKPVPAHSPKKLGPVDDIHSEMGFPGAMKSVIGGKKVTRAAWNNPNIFVSMYGADLTIKMEDGLFHPFLIRDGDMLAEDWIVV